MNISFKKDAKNGDTDAFMTLIELTYNFWNLAYRDIMDKDSQNGWNNNFFHLRDVMLDNLEKYNHKAYIENERILIIEDKPEVTAVVEIIEQDLAIDIIRYNHRSLQGEIELKKKILISLGSELEPKRKELQALNKQLSEDIFFMLTERTTSQEILLYYLTLTLFAGEIIRQPCFLISIYLWLCVSTRLQICRFTRIKINWAAGTL